MATPYESEFIEFKRGMPSAGNLAKEIVAFANSAGGEIYLEVEKDSTAVGITVTSELLDRIQNICNTIEPPIMPRLGPRAIKGQEVLVINMGYIEKWGSGVIAMKQTMRTWGLPTPKFEDFGTVRVTLYGPGKEAVEELVRPHTRELKEAGFPRWLLGP